LRWSIAQHLILWPSGTLSLDLFLLFNQCLFSLNLLIQLSKVGFGEPVGTHELHDLTVDVALQLWVGITILLEELGGKHTFELFTLLDLFEAVPP